MEMKRVWPIALVAHFALIGSIVADFYRRASSESVMGILAVIGAVLVLPSFIYFVLRPKAFFFIRGGGAETPRTPQDIKKQFWISLGSWLFVVGWSVGWLLLVTRLSDYMPPLMARISGTYLFMMGLVISILLSRNLFPWRNNK